MALKRALKCPPPVTLDDILIEPQMVGATDRDPPLCPRQMHLAREVLCESQETIDTGSQSADFPDCMSAVASEVVVPAMRTSEPLEGLLQQDVSMDEPPRATSNDGFVPEVSRVAPRFSNPCEMTEYLSESSDELVDTSGDVFFCVSFREPVQDYCESGSSLSEVPADARCSEHSPISSSRSDSEILSFSEPYLSEGSLTSHLSLGSQAVVCMRSRLTVQSFEDEKITKMFHEANTTKVKENAWDLSLFLFYRPLGVTTNIMVFLCVAFNSLLQLSFTYLVAGFIAFSNEDLGDLAADFAVWRDGASTRVRALVCESSFVSGSDFKQLDTRITFNEFTTSNAGMTLCMAVCAAWSLAVLRVIGEVLDQVKALRYLVRKDCKIMEIGVAEHGFTLEKIPLHRFGFFLWMCSVQFFIALMLLIAGDIWLASTTDIVELLLNGIALAYIMEIDELTYRVLVPTKLDTLIKRLSPNAVDWSMSLPTRSMILSIPLCVINVVVYSQLVLPHANAVVSVEEALCP